MKVADKDEVIHSTLAEEYQRCREVLQALRTKAENLPKGALNVRRKQIKGNEYVYHYLVRREGRKVVNQHVAEKDLPELQKQIEERDKYRKEILIYKKRMVYLERLLGGTGGQGPGERGLVSGQQL